MKFNLTEEEKNRIHNLYYPKTDNREIISESVLSTLLSRLFKGFSKSVSASVENSLKKVVDDVVLKGAGKTVTMASIRNNANYKAALRQAIEEASRAKYRMTFDQLSNSPKFGTQVVDELIGQVDDAMKQELQAAAKAQGKTVGADLKASEKALTKAQSSVTNAGKKIKGKTVVPATKEELNALTKTWKTNTRLNNKVSSAKDSIKNLKPLTRAQVDKLLKSAKTTTGSADDISRGLRGGNKTVKTPNGGFFTATRDQIKNLPGTITKVVLTRSVAKSMIILGVSVAAIYLLYQALFPNDSIIIEDENGNELTDDGSTWAPCVQDFITNKQGEVKTSQSGEVYVLVKPTEYPDGLQFYVNGRVMNVKTGEMGSWSCKNKVAQIPENLNEQTDEEVNKDVEEMIDLLDFPTSSSDLQKALDKIKKYASSPKGKEFIELYNGSGIVDTDIKSDVSSTYVTSATGTRAKSEILKLINQIESGKVTTPTPTPGTTGSASVSNIDIKWDTKDDGGGGGSKTQQSKYQKCNDFPMNIYCISDKIKEVQKCLGVKDDGKFGPITSEKLGSKTLTKELYDTILANCKTGGDSDKVTEPKREMKPLEPVKIANIEKPDLSVKLPNKLPAVNIPTIKQSKNSFYNALKANGNIVGDTEETVLDDGTVLPANRRIKYKGPDLNPEQVQMLDDVMAELEYDRIKQKLDKRYGEKYVWLKK